MNVRLLTISLRHGALFPPANHGCGPRPGSSCNLILHPHTPEVTKTYASSSNRSQNQRTERYDRKKLPTKQIILKKKAYPLSPKGEEETTAFSNPSPKRPAAINAKLRGIGKQRERKDFSHQPTRKLNIRFFFPLLSNVLAIWANDR